MLWPPPLHRMLQLEKAQLPAVLDPKRRQRGLPVLDPCDWDIPISSGRQPGIGQLGRLTSGRFYIGISVMSDLYLFFFFSPYTIVH